MQVTIRGVSQDFSLETSENYSYMTFVLPDGTEARALIDDEVLQRIVTLTVKNGGVPQRPRGQVVPQAPQLQRSEGPAQMPEDRAYTPMSLDGDGPVEFGGDFNGTEGGQLAVVGAQLKAAEERVTSATAFGDPNNFSPEEVRAAAARLREPAQADLPQPQWDETPVALPVRTVGHVVAHVSADERGNPVLRGNNIVDTNQLVGGNTEGEEDGIGQL
jgi:hypothetical protein